MKPMIWLGIVGIVAVAVAIVLAVMGTPAPDRKAAGTQPAREPKVRQAAVAGLFYPSHAEELAKTVDQFLAEVKAPAVENLRALVCPHAGYPYSGMVAAVAYKQLTRRSIDTVLILGPSHYAAFKGAYIPDVDAYETPLGKVMLSPLAKELARQQPFASNVQSQVQRPNWWRQSPKELPAFGQETPDTWEHSLEVQIPFLQKVAPKATIVPIVYGDVDGQEVAKALAGHINQNTVLVASSDLSHYMPYETAKHLDQACVSAVLQLDMQRMRQQEACGKGPILTLMHLAREKGWQAKLLDYRNSGDTAGDKAGVVGYAAIAFYQSSTPGTAPATAPAAEARGYSLIERRFLLSLARMTLTEAVTNRRVQPIDLATVPPRLVERKGCFVTLTKKGKLRGCVGYITPEKPLFQAVMENAVHAALNDRRFAPVEKSELGDIEVEISVLTVPQPLQFDSPDDLLAKLRPGKDGVVLRVGQQQATYLPQVWEQIPKKEDFLSHLAEKAGLPQNAWREKGAVIETYQDEAFKESEP
jgi:hypothetical protein